MADTYRLKTPERSPDLPLSVDEPFSRGAKRSRRIVSLDAYRGFIMIALAAHGFGFSDFANLPQEAPAWKIADYGTWQTIGHHFRHAKWVAVDKTHGIAFWDLIQPSFMFMVGVAMPFSYSRRSAFGHSAVRQSLHALFRAVILVLMGVFLYSLGQSRTNWIFPNVLAQIGLGYFFVYLLLSRPPAIQLSAVAAILVGYWALFYFNPPPEDYDYAAVNASVEEGNVFTDHMAPWSKNGNVAFRFDQWLLPQLRTQVTADADAGREDAATETGEPVGGVTRDQPEKLGILRQWFFSNTTEYQFNRSGYTTLNFIPSIATALLGVLCGQLLISGKGPGYVIFRLLIGGGVCLVLGLTAHGTVCPIVKIIWTPSWTLFSGGCVIWMLAAFYLLFDALPFRKLALPLQVIGINSLAVYLMGELLRGWVGEKVVAIHLSGFLETVFGPEAMSDNMLGHIIRPTTVALVFWLLAVFMYRRRMFLRV